MWDMRIIVEAIWRSLERIWDHRHLFPNKTLPNNVGHINLMCPLEVLLSRKRTPLSIIEAVVPIMATKQSRTQPLLCPFPFTIGRIQFSQYFKVQGHLEGETNLSNILRKH